MFLCLFAFFLFFFFELLLDVCVLRLGFITEAPLLSILLQLLIFLPLAGYFFSSIPPQSPQASPPAVQLNPERAGLFSSIPNQQKISAMFLGQVH